MPLDRVFFCFFIIAALTLNFGFFIGDMDNPNHHHIYELFFAFIVNLIAFFLKFGDKTSIGALQLSTSLVATIQLFIAACIWGWTTHSGTDSSLIEVMPSIVSFSGGAFLANIISIILLIIETIIFRK